MTVLVPNISKGKIAYYAGLPLTNDAIVWVLFSGTETDDNIRDADNLTAVLATGLDEATFTGYARVTATSVTVSVDDTNNWVIADAADPSWSPASAQALTRIGCFYDPDTTVGTDADLIPLFFDDFALTTSTNGVLGYTVASTGFFKAS